MTEIEQIYYKECDEKKVPYYALTDIIEQIEKVFGDDFIIRNEKEMQSIISSLLQQYIKLSKTIGYCP